jgi:hypothetical protein
MLLAKIHSHATSSCATTDTHIYTIFPFFSPIMELLFYYSQNIPGVSLLQYSLSTCLRCAKYFLLSLVTKRAPLLYTSRKKLALYTRGYRSVTTSSRKENVLNKDSPARRKMTNDNLRFPPSQQRLVCTTVLAGCSGTIEMQVMEQASVQTKV